MARNRLSWLIGLACGTALTLTALHAAATSCAPPREQLTLEIESVTGGEGSVETFAGITLQIHGGYYEVSTQYIGEYAGGTLGPGVLTEVHDQFWE